MSAPRKGVRSPLRIVSDPTARPLRVAVTGSERGQLHRALFACVPPGIEAFPLSGADGGRLDITDRDAVLRAVAALRPDAIVNAAAWTAVDLAEAQPEAARAVNALGPAHLAEAASERGSHLVQVSTDFVFGTGDGTPFAEDAPTAPLGVYGATKREGELAVLEGAPGAAVVRTAWMHSAQPGNFVSTMLRLMGERETLSVVADQVGAPTRAASVATALWRTVARRTGGTLHWTGAGVASWYDFAVAIAEEGEARGLVPPDRRVRAICAREYATPAARPSWSVLSLVRTQEVLGLEAPHWRDGLRATLDEFAARAAGGTRTDRSATAASASGRAAGGPAPSSAAPQPPHDTAGDAS